MRRNSILTLAAVLGLAACNAAEIDQAPVRYKATKSLGEVGSAAFTVRTYARIDGKRSELKGVPCTFKGDGFQSSFATPAAVMSPNMQGRTPPASVSCTYKGETRTKPIAPYNKTIADINTSTAGYAYGAGLVGALVGAGVAAVQASNRDVSQDVYAYPDVQIEFRG